jgi:hypothetical protein
MKFELWRAIRLDVHHAERSSRFTGKAGVGAIVCELALGVGVEAEVVFAAPLDGRIRRDESIDVNVIVINIDGRKRHAVSAVLIVNEPSLAAALKRLVYAVPGGDPRNCDAFV